MERLHIYTKEHLLSLTSIREGETKLGEKLQLVSGLENLTSLSCKFVLLGLPEDIGVRANFGLGGAHTAWEPALKTLVNIQSTKRFTGEEMAVLGHLDFEGELKAAEDLNPHHVNDLEQMRDLVSKIDDRVTGLLQMIFNAGKIPIIIGGGHNNSYPILRALSRQFNRPVNTINLDAHSDFRIMEGRHSGNGFRYALRENFLNKYAVLGLQENYNSQSLVDEMTALKSQIRYYFLEDFIRENDSHDRAFQDAMNFTEGICGLEVDLDCIGGALSSAISPTGFTVTQVREMITQTKLRQFFYLHIAEGAVHLTDGREDQLTGKLIATLISDFVKAQLR
ncbi:arginase family protein [Daejeonella oryzae]|uniref:arginase family protein n=1 Tax=Daejeonella oryzae TaxID=1122943 RepID=UPI00047A9255|nr:arginase family protein [Daejeonella oryzae]